MIHSFCLHAISLPPFFFYTFLIMYTFYTFAYIYIKICIVIKEFQCTAYCVLCTYVTNKIWI